jgi:hypothetical protein
MFQWAELRLAALAFSTGLAVWLASSPFRAFSRENLRSGGVGNPAFADPGDQVKNFRSGARPFGPNGPIVQFGAQRSPLNPFVSRATTTTPRQSPTLDLWATATESLARTYVFCSDRLRFT